MKIFNFFKKKKVIIRGIQRSGTNFLENLSHRLDLKVINKGDIPRNSPKHKHFRVQNDKTSIFMDKQYLNEIYVDNIQDLNFLVLKEKRLKNILIIKDPINWILSINRWAKKCGWISKEKNLTDDFDLMSKYLKEWDNFHLKWLDLATEKDQLLILQWENLLTNFHDNLEKIGNFMELKNYNQNLNISDFRNINLSEDSKIQDIEKIDTELSHKIYNLIKFNDFKKIY